MSVRAALAQSSRATSSLVALRKGPWRAYAFLGRSGVAHYVIDHYSHGYRRREVFDTKYRISRCGTSIGRARITICRNPSGRVGSIYDHCIRAEESVHKGVQGLPLIGSGDWNDGMNRGKARGREKRVAAWFL